MVLKEASSRIVEARYTKKNQLPDSYWHEYGSSLSRYQEVFDNVLRGQRIADLLEGKSSPVILDLMAPSDTVSDLIGTLDRPETATAIALSLEDLREPWQKTRDENTGITQLAGDIAKGSTWRKLDQAMGGKKADLILERGEGGICHLPANEAMLSGILSRVWNLLSSDDGVALLQIPTFVFLQSKNIRYQEWFQMLKGVNVSIDASTQFHSTIRIDKSPDSPMELPTLPAR